MEIPYTAEFPLINAESVVQRQLEAYNAQDLEAEGQR